jgi:hypothetical protein
MVRELRESTQTAQEKPERAQIPLYYGRGSGGRTAALMA